MAKILDIHNRKTLCLLYIFLVIIGTIASGPTGGLTAPITMIGTTLLVKEIGDFINQRRDKTMITYEKAINFLKQAIQQVPEERRKNLELDDIDIKIFRGSWDGESYKEIAKTVPILRRHVENRGGKLWKKISTLLDKNVTKYNFKSQIEDAINSGTIIDIEKNVQEPQLRNIVKKRIKATLEEYKGIELEFLIKIRATYTPVNIFTKVRFYQRTEIGSSQEIIYAKSDPGKNDDLALYPVMKRGAISGLEAVERYPKLLIFGDPGSGKTTFLRHLAIECIDGNILGNYLPIFVALKFLKNSQDKEHNILLKRIQQVYNIEEQELERELIRTLQQGQALVLLDGWDEVEEENIDSVDETIHDFHTMFPENRYVITCRNAAMDIPFEQFRLVEIAQFEKSQIEECSSKIFKEINPDDAEDLICEFRKKIATEKRTKELTANPFLLTFICVIFAKTRKLPKYRYKLYEEVLTLILETWDYKRRITSNVINNNLSTQHKKDALSYIAFVTLSQGNNLFEKEKILEYIEDYIQSLQEAQTEPKNLHPETVLKSIEVQYGLLVQWFKDIYGFYHQTLHEYFTARYIVEDSNPEVINRNLKNLLTRLNNRQWREVFLLTVEMLRDSSNFLISMKAEVDKIAREDDYLQKVLNWINKKSSLVEHDYKNACVRAIYLDFVVNLNFAPYASLRFPQYQETYGLSIDVKLSDNLGIALASELKEINSFSDRWQGLDYGLDRTIDERLNSESIFSVERHKIADRSEMLSLVKTNDRDRNSLLEDVLEIVREPELKAELQSLKARLPNANLDEETRNQWWRENGKDWTEDLRTVMINYRNIGHDWKFTDQQYNLLKQYYNANLLLVDCLHQSRYISREVREKIEATLLLPIAQIQNRPQPRNHP